MRQLGGVFPGIHVELPMVNLVITILSIIDLPIIINLRLVRG
jgi:hypothetical protein